MKETCKHCRYWVNGKDNPHAQINEGECHRYAPKTATREERYEWPIVRAETFCGEFVSKTEAN